MSDFSTRATQIVAHLHPPFRPEVATFVAAFYDSPAPHEDDFNLFRKIPGEQLAFLDVGANVGLSAISMAKCCPNALGLGFEANTSLDKILALAAEYCGNYRYILQGMSDTAATGKLHIPVVDGFAEYGEASLSAENFERPGVSARLRAYSSTGDFTLAIVDTSFDVLDHLVLAAETLAARPIRLLKIDVEGHELQVISGAKTLIATYRPMVLVEEGDRPEIVAAMQALDYKAYVIDETASVSLPGAVPQLNTLFLADQHLPMLHAFAACNRV